jgi:AraC family transcriptional regulator
MDWLERMNDVVEYIETHLDSDIDYKVLSKMLFCSTCEFSRIFSFVTGMSVSEYIRHRKLSQAA